jgi:hypothetical protein
VLPKDGTVHVVVRRFCDVLGVDAEGQRQKLSKAEWATTCVIKAVAEDGKTRELFCLDLDSLPMWLVKIEPGRVKPEVRPKLIRYQRECARVLRDHFLGSRDGVGAAQVAAVLGQMVVLLTAMTAKFDDLSKRVAAVEDRRTSIIDPRDEAWLRGELRTIARLEVALKLRTSFRSAHRRLQNEIGSYVHWIGSGRAWRHLPAERFALAKAWITEKRAAVDAAGDAIASASQLRLPIDDGDPDKTKH